LIRVKLTSIKI